MKKTIFYAILSVSLGIAVIGCKKKAAKADSSEDTDVTIANDQYLADETFNDAQNISDQASRGKLVFYLPQATNSHDIAYSEGIEKSSCATITRDSVSIPHRITVDFGSTNCSCNDGKNRRGKILVTYEGQYRDSASVHTITFDNYFVNDNQVLGTKTVTNNGHNSQGNLTYTIHVDGQIIKANNSGTITWTADRIREWTTGENTFVWIDDVYSITGTTSGTRANGTTFSTVIQTPLVRALSCRWFESGSIQITPSNKPVRTVNYGTGGCDANATVSLNGHIYPIVLN